MANVYPTTTLTKNILIADDLQSSTTSGTTTTKTQIVLTNSSCGLEMQSTTSGFVLPRMTTTNRNALTGTAGMQVYNSTTNTVDTYQNAAWTGGLGVVSGTLTAAAITTTNGGIYATPVQLIASPGAGNLIVVDFCVVELVYGTTQYTNGGTIYLQYGSTTHAGGPHATVGINNSFLLNNAASHIIMVSGALADTAVATITANSAIYISNDTQVFAAGDSPLNYSIYYHVLPIT